jgi:hypothetical protein
MQGNGKVCNGCIQPNTEPVSELGVGKLVIDRASIEGIVLFRWSASRRDAFSFEDTGAIWSRIL